MKSDNKLSRWVLRFDGAFLAFAGGTAMVFETVGHFLGVGPMAVTQGSPDTIGGFEAHGLAILIAALLFRAGSLEDSMPWHAVGLITHLFLGFTNLLFWFSFTHYDLVIVGVVSTILHAILVVAHGVCLLGGHGTARRPRT